MNNLKAERTLTAAIKGEGFEASTGGFEFIICGDRKFTAEEVRQSLSTQQPMGEVRVKALEWLPEKYGDHVLGWRSVSSVIRYFVEDMGSGCGEWRYWLQRGDHVIAKCASEEEAKAAAQSNYDTTILYALHPNQESGE